MLFLLLGLKLRAAAQHFVERYEACGTRQLRVDHGLLSREVRALAVEHFQIAVGAIFVALFAQTKRFGRCCGKLLLSQKLVGNRTFGG